MPQTYWQREGSVKRSGEPVSPRSAILSAVIFNALIIIALVPLALRGVRFRAEAAAVVLRRNLVVYGLGGTIARSSASNSSTSP
jgi:high-affinity K+ transport system ATPase subunit B